MVTISNVYLGDYLLDDAATNYIASGTYPIYVDLFNDYTLNASVKVFVEVYEKIPPEGLKEVVLYETSFEDNFDIYNNWIQVDIDCGLDAEGNVGFFDTWTWSDKRAFTGEHSFKCTMYDHYKGNQDDYFQCTQSFDVSDQYKVNVSFNIWVEGQGDTPTGWWVYSIYDFLAFEVGDDTGYFFNPWDNMVFRGPDWSILDGSYYFFDTSIDVYTAYVPYTNYYPKARNLGGGWWHVWYEVEVDELAAMGLNVEDILFRFAWQSDPQFQYEGAYVDDFKVVSIEPYEFKIFQTHTQGPVVVTPCVFPEDVTTVELPLPVTLEYKGISKETPYDIIVWIEVTDPATFWTPHDWTYPDWWILEGNDPEDYPGPIDYYVKVGDYYDVIIEDFEMETSFDQEPIADESIVMQGDDIHITAQVHIEGTIPGYDIAITAYAQKKTWETIFYTDCENMMDWPMSFGFVHITDRDSWTGAKCIGFFDEIENEYPVGAFSYILGPTVDFAEYEEVVLDFYTKYNTEFFYDYVRPCLLDQYAGFVLGLSPPLTGYSSGWIGPMQPGGLYESYDLDAAYRFFRDTYGFFRTGDGKIFTEVTIGFYMVSDPMYYGDSRDNHHHVQKLGWSGVMIDAITIKGQKLSDPVWQDVVVIPGPAEPSETYEVQFEWEDVPYSNYRITVECADEKACGNWEQGSLSKQILVVSKKEKVHPKEIEFIDQSGKDVGRWGLCGSGTDWYMSTNPDSWFYPDDAAYYTALAIDGVECLDLSDLGPSSVVIEFEAWWDLDIMSGDKVIIQVANCVDGVPPDDFGDWITLPTYWDWFWWPIPYFIHSSEMIFPDLEDGWVPIVSDDLAFYIDVTQPFAVRFVMLTYSPYAFRGFLMDSLSVIVDGEVFYGPDEFNTDENWVYGYIQYGTYWEYIETANYTAWCAEWPAGIPFDDKMIWHTEIMDCYEAYLTIVHEYYFPQAWDYDMWQQKWTYLGRSVGYIELSTDGENWYELGEYVPPDPYAVTSGYNVEHFVLTPWIGHRIQIRFRATTEGALLGGYWCVYDMHITGKQDHTPPVSTIAMSGTMKDSGWYSTPVKVTITATDDASGVKEIHYVLDGVETVVAGDKAQFTVSDNGYHNIEYWAVDKVGNVEQKKTVPTFKIDTGSPPDVAIVAPTPGLYIFGNKILDISKIIIIGAFTIEATASDAESGVYRVQFYLNGDIIGEDTTAPYSTYCAVKHSGDATIKVVAEDFAQNIAEDTLEIKYYKFL
jgi:hypothetical protein